MLIKDLYESKKDIFSIEVFPPKKTSSVDTVFKTLSGLKNLPVDFISVTYGAGGSQTQKNKTIEIASLIKSEYGIEPLVHLTCVSSSQEEVKEILDTLKRENINNILALRGDIPQGGRVCNDFEHASDLAAFIKKYDAGFSISGACYPKGHFESASLEEDVENLKKKVQSGISHFITQLFFDNDVFYRFMELMEAKQINVPVETGIMPITSTSQIERAVSMCGASIPDRFAKLLTKYSDSPDDLKRAGIEYALEQMNDLKAHGIKGIHLYAMNNVELASRISSEIVK